MLLVAGVDAQEVNQIYIDHDTYIDLQLSEPPSVDTTLFKVYLRQSDDLYSQLTRYIYAPITTKRKGAEWWQRSSIYREVSSANVDFITPATQRYARAYTSTSGYRVGASVQLSGEIKKGWHYSSRMDYRTGRDANVEGVFRNQFSLQGQIVKRLSDSDHITISAELPYTMRGLRGSATQECYTLTGNNLYNPLWGYYNGEVRNSRVVRNLLPQAQVRYQRALSESTIASVSVDGEYGTKRMSRLGWYDSYNPTPNYYSKLPSYFYGSSVYDEAMKIWSQNDTDYTQIGWDRLVEINSTSTSGEAHYVVEDRVERVADVDMSLLFSTQLSRSAKITYGGFVNFDNRRNYKQMRDLLGAEYLTDLDQYAGDFVQVGSEMQNNLRSPNRQIREGDRFGYDYSLVRSHIGALVGLEYRTRTVDVVSEISLGEESIHRDGHYEKERFSGSGSYGESQKISLSTYNISLRAGYAIAPQHNISLSVNLDQSAPISRYLFVAAENANRTIDSPTTEKGSSFSLRYLYSASKVRVVVEGYALLLSDMGQVWQGYDDMSSTYCDIVISDIATRSIGVEVSAEADLLRNLKLSATFAAGKYIYTSAPLVTLYDDVDMSVVATSRASTLKRYIVGNAPQLSATTSLTYFLKRGVTLDMDMFYYAYRYTSPSIVRRTDRLVNFMSSIESCDELLNQQALPSLFNANFSVIKSFRLKNDTRITALVKVENLLGGEDIITTAREGNRVLSSSYLQESTLEYSVGRTFYVSVGYRF